MRSRPGGAAAHCRNSRNPQCVVSVLLDILRQVYDTFMLGVYMFLVFRVFLETLCHLISLT
jgi:hypothetical protein